MSDESALRRYFAEFVVVFVGVALAFAVENLREDLNEREVGDQYLDGFRRDLLSDLDMLRAAQETRRTQHRNSAVILEFFEGRAPDPQVFFEAYYQTLVSSYTLPNRTTMDEVLSSGSLRLIRNPEIRTGLLELYTLYENIARHEDHIARDYDHYLYDPTFSTIPFHFIGPWENTPENRAYVEALVSDVRIENGIRLLVVNLDAPGFGLMEELDEAQAQVEALLAKMPVD